MKLKFGVKEGLVLILISILLGATSLIELGSADYPLNPVVLLLRYVLASLCLGLLIGLSLLERKTWESWQFNHNFRPLLYLWIAFSAMVEISGCINNDLVSIRDGYWFMIGVPLIFFYILPKLLKHSAHIMVAMSLVLGHIPYILASFIFAFPGTTDFIFYRGVLGNSNQLGFVSAVTAAGVLILLIGAFGAKKLAYQIPLLICLLALSFLAIYFAFARTSMLNFLLLLFICFAVISSRYPRSFVKLAFVIGVVGSIVLFQANKLVVFLVYDLRLDFAGIFQRKESGLSGRELIWLRTIQESSILGHGSQYYESFGQGPHNTVIKTLGMYGAIAAYLIIFVAIATLISAYAYFKAHFKDDYYAIMPLIVSVCFWTLSLGEDMFGSLGKGITLAYFISMGVMMTRYNPAAIKQSELPPRNSRLRDPSI